MRILVLRKQIFPNQRAQLKSKWLNIFFNRFFTKIGVCRTQEKKEQGKIAAKSPDVEVSKKSETEEKEDEQSQMKSDNVQEIEDQKQSGDNKEINEVFEDKEKDQGSKCLEF